MDTADLVVIGGGAAGLSAAQTAAAQGRRVLLVESGQLGGECTWNGCVPSKALIEAARLRHQTSRAHRFGITTGAVGVDFGAVMRRVQEVIGQIARFEDVEHLNRDGIEVRHGTASLGRPASLDERGRPVPTTRLTVNIDEERVIADRVVICTGSRPALPPVHGLAETPHLTNETIFRLTEQPRHLLVIGAGPIGLELAQAFARLGTEVTVVDASPILLPREDPELVAVAERVLAAEGIRILLRVEITNATGENHSRRLTVTGDGAQTVLEGDALLVAAGRQPRVEGLGLEALGVSVEKRGITVDEFLRTTAAGVYAAGDVTGLHPFTHAAAAQGRLAARNAFTRRRVKLDERVLPWITFTDPEIAHVGLTEPEARQAHGDDIHVATLPFTAVDRAVIQGDIEGIIKVITRGKPLLGHLGGGEVLGAHIVGPSAGELIHEFVVAMTTRSFAGRLARATHAYPSMAMGVQQAVAQLFQAGRTTAGDLREELRDQVIEPQEPVC